MLFQIQDQTQTNSGNSSANLNVTAIAQAAVATLKVVDGSRQQAIEKQKATIGDVAVDGQQLDPDLIDQANEIVEELTSKVHTATFLPNHHLCVSFSLFHPFQQLLIFSSELVGLK